ncbi:response regulator transcription factor [Paenibacillus woosongensis]|uniref:Response regulator transcription factor n=1 Tax=Paenibacillus woosongensis TaxID=307580 RepID=A0AA95I1I2_9BACL|nr:response regulator transcription factor [Paenibacillus woosongensis]WHX48824.1 response regulator transcription factor [Paenibacillus woosongensis]
MQAEEVKKRVQSGSVTPFRRPEQGLGYNEQLFGNDYPQACPVTQRVILVSPFPSEIYELVRDLSVGCFDVLVFHHLEQGLRNALAADLVIFDLTAYRGSEEVSMLTKRMLQDLEDVPSLLLVNEAMLSQMDPSLMHLELLVWPSSPHEILYHVQRIIRTSNHRPASGALPAGGTSTYKDLWIDRKKMQVYRSGIAIELTKTEYELLIKLLDHEGSVLSREELLADVWETSFMGGSNVVDVHIKSLRKKLGDRAANPTYIATVRGVGYRLAD